MCCRRCMLRLDHKTNRGMAGNGKSSRPSSNLLQCSLPSPGSLAIRFPAVLPMVPVFPALFLAMPPCMTKTSKTTD